MASYTDNPQALTNFKPYVELAPYEEMLAVASEKQAKYDVGVQKIQQQIDTVAGLEIARGVDKNYLQSKLNNLGNNLKTVAAGDFSNFQLVNSVAGMANQITKDDVIQEAVSSTARIKKQQSKLESAQKEGKSSVANEWDFIDGVNRYMSSEILKDSYNGKYTNYTDVNKKAIEAIKGLHPDLMQFDNPYFLDATGKICPTCIADAMKKTKIEGIDEDKIRQVISATLSPDDINQLSIDGRYSFRNYGVEDLKEKLTKDFEGETKYLKKQIEDLTSNLEGESDPSKSLKIKERIDKYTEKLGGIDSPNSLSFEYKNSLELANKNPDAIKAMYYKKGFIDEFANAFKWKTHTEEIVTSPLKAQDNFKSELLLKQKILQANIKDDAAKNEIARRNSDIQAERNQIAWIKVQMEALEKAKAAEGSSTPRIPLGDPTTNKLEGPELFDASRQSISNSIDKDIDFLKSKGYSQAFIDKNLKKWMDNNGNISIDQNLKPIFQNLAKNNNDLEAMNAFNNRIKKQSYNSVLNSPDNKKVIDSELVGKPLLNLKYGDTEVQLSQAEIVGLQTAEIWDPNQSTVAYAEPIFGIKSSTRYDMSKLNENQKRFLRFKEKINSGNSPFKNQINSAITKTFAQYGTAVAKTKALNKKAHEKYLDNLAVYSNAFVPTIQSVGFDKKKELPGDVINNLRAFNVSTSFQKIKGNEKYNSTVVQDMLDKDNWKNTEVYVKQQGDNYTIQLHQKGKDTQEFQASREQVINILGTKYINDEQRFSAKMIYGSGNTNLNSNPKDAQLQQQFGNFPNVKKYNIKADVNQSFSNPGVYTGFINILLKNGKYQSFQDIPTTPRNYIQLQNDYNNLTDESLIKHLKINYPNFDYSLLKTN